MCRKKLFKSCARLLLACGVLLACVRPVSAQDTVLISGNPDLYPIESYDHRSERYVGLLPELYERLGERLDCAFVYLPYSSQTTQAQQAENRQADIISAFPDGAVSESSLQGRVLISVQAVGGETRQIYVGFTDLLSPSRVEALEQALEDISGAERLGILADQANAGGDRPYRMRFFVTLAVLGAVTLAAAASQPLVLYSARGASRACRNIARRLCDIKTPLLRL